MFRRTTFFIDSVPWRCERAGPLRLLQGQPWLEHARRDATGKKVGWCAGGVTVNAPDGFSLIAIYRFGALFKYDGFDGGGVGSVYAEVDVGRDGFWMRDVTDP